MCNEGNIKITEILRAKYVKKLNKVNVVYMQYMSCNLKLLIITSEIIPTF